MREFKNPNFKMEKTNQQIIDDVISIAASNFPFQIDVELDSKGRLRLVIDDRQLDQQQLARIETYANSLRGGIIRRFLNP